jgi:hypothetical protein
MNTGPKTACTYKYTCFQALTSVPRGELMTNPAVDPHSQHALNAISQNTTTLPTTHGGKPVPDFTLAKRPTPRHFNNLRPSQALLSFSTDTTHRAFATATNSEQHDPADSKTQPRAGTKANAMLSRRGGNVGSSEEPVPRSA